MNKQIRELRCEMRVSATGKKMIGWIPYQSEADLGGFTEMLQPGCFSESIRSGKRIVALWSHDTAKPLVSTTAGSLRLEDRQDGLRVEIEPDTELSWAKDALLAAKAGSLGGISFGFTVPRGGDSWNGTRRTIKRAELHEISPCVFPAYTESSISLRNNIMNNNNGEITLSKRDYQAFSEWRNQSINTPPNMPLNGHITIEDAPIYRGPLALGQQMVDIAIMSRSGSPGADEAHSRFEAMVKREKTLAEKRAAGTGGMVEAVGQDGGLLLQGETAVDLLSHGFNNSTVLSRASRRNLGVAQFIELVGVDETSRADGSRGGGVRVYSDKELEQILQSKTKFDKIRIEPKRLTGLYFASNEILENAAMLQGEMENLFTEEFGFKGQDLAINGSGAGEALGVLNAPCLVTVAAEANQPAGTITFQNLLSMKSRLRSRNRKSLLWLANQDVEPQLHQISLPIGTGGALIPAFIPTNNPESEIAGTLLGVPLSFIEQCETLGTVGDTILADWSMYYAANKGGIQSASSIHLKFDYNQTTFRFVTWFDGQPRMKSAIMPFKGSNTVSPFVALATR